MRKKILTFFAIPAEIRTAYWQDAVRSNQLSLLVICIMILGMELYNMVRVLFLSNSGLGTLNNRIYFSLYCTLFLAAVLYLILQHLLRGAQTMVQWRFQFGTVAFCFLWHICLNSYDLIRGFHDETGTFITAILGLAVFIRMPARFSVPTYTLGYALFMILGSHALSSGAILNLTISTIVALAVSLTSSRHAVIRLTQQQEINEMNARLQQLIRQDPLTGLLNTSAVHRCVETLLAQASDQQPFSLCIVDLDDFKEINDRFGHPCGDYILKETALRLRAIFPQAQCLGRIGGDEFAVAIAGPQLPEELEQLSCQLLRTLATLHWQGQAGNVSCSLGLCQTARADLSFELLYALADRALYQAKAQGKARCLIRNYP